MKTARENLELSQNSILINYFVLSRNKKIICGCAVVAKNQQKITCDRDLQGSKIYEFLKRH